MALFGEKYGEEVRVLSMGIEDDATYSVELCGGTHVHALGDIQLLKITGESAVASGVRRIEALTGEAARKWLTAREDKLKESAAALKSLPEEVPDRVRTLLEEKKRLERELATARQSISLHETGSYEPDLEFVHDGVRVVLEMKSNYNPKELKPLADRLKAYIGSGVVVALADFGGKASVVVGVTDDLTARYSASDLVKPAVVALGGSGGGGRPDLAQGGGPGPADLTAVADLLKRAMAEGVAA
jgi:alanyl-tRNA synthetase